MDLGFPIVLSLGSFKNKEWTRAHNWACTDSDVQKQYQQHYFDCSRNGLKKTYIVSLLFDLTCHESEAAELQPKYLLDLSTSSNIITTVKQHNKADIYHLLVWDWGRRCSL